MIRRKAAKALHVVGLIGFPSMALMLVAGRQLGMLLYQNEKAGGHIPMLAAITLLGFYYAVAESVLEKHRFAKALLGADGGCQPGGTAVYPVVGWCAGTGTERVSAGRAFLCRIGCRTVPVLGVQKGRAAHSPGKLGDATAAGICYSGSADTTAVIPAVSDTDSTDFGAGIFCRGVSFIIYFLFAVAGYRFLELYTKHPAEKREKIRLHRASCCIIMRTKTTGGREKWQ